MRAQVNLGTGALERWEVAGHSLLAAGVAPCLFRAPLDNDLGGSGKTSFASRCCQGLSECLSQLPVTSQCRQFNNVHAFLPASLACASGSVLLSSTKIFRLECCHSLKFLYLHKKWA